MNITDSLRGATLFARLWILWLIVALGSAIYTPTALGQAGDPVLDQALKAQSIRVEGAFSGSADTVVGGALFPEGARWDSAGAVILKAGQSSLVITLPAEQQVSAFLIQADNNDAYFVEGSNDGNAWRLLWSAPPETRYQGLRSRYGILDVPARARLLRIRPGVGDGSYSIARFFAFGAVPERTPEVIRAQRRNFSLVEYFPEERMNQFKRVIAALGVAFIAGLFVLARHRIPLKKFGLGQFTLALSGILSLCLWWNLGRYHFDSYVHTWDMFHYYIGAKYFPELGYTKLYDCTATADVEAGMRDALEHDRIRNLETNKLELYTEVIAHPERCKDGFSSGRWQDFKADIGWFRAQMSGERWSDLKRDHGFNGSPVWLILGRLFADSTPMSWPKAYWLATIDVILALVMWGVVCWAFGWETACVAALFWGTNFPARFYWIGGSLLRQDWLVALICGIALLKRGFPGWAAAALTYATLLRVFPGYVGFAVVLKIAWGMWRRRSLFPNDDERRFLLGGVSALVLLVSLSFVATQRFDAYQGFVRNSEKHLQTPLTNNMGLKTWLAYSADTNGKTLKDPIARDPFEVWKQSELDRFAARKWEFAAIILAYLALLVVATRQAALWETAALGVGLIVLAAELTCYYYSFLLALAFFWRRASFIPVLLLAFAWLSCESAVRWEWFDDSLAWTSFGAITLVFLSVIFFWREERERIERSSRAESQGSALSRLQNP